jgi:predicted acylesterase/phospholipase RssA
MLEISLDSVMQVEEREEVREDLRSEARAIIDGRDVSAADLKPLADALRDDGQTGLVAEMLMAVSRRALRDEWRPDERAELAIDVLRDHQQFNYARRLLNRIRLLQDSELLRQQHALCTYKDLELPAARRLDRALQILGEPAPLEQSHSAETLGIAGAIHKRRWEVGAKREDLERALWCYRSGYKQDDQPERWYAGVNAAFVADQLATLEDKPPGSSSHAQALREEADAIRARIVDELEGGDGGWNDASRGEALFGLGRFDEARAALVAARRSKALWRHETTAMQVAELARLRGFADNSDAVDALSHFVGGHIGALGRASVGKVGLALSGGGYRASLFHIGVLARLAECNVLRRIEILSCVSGGSILGAYYYLKLRDLLERTPDNDVRDADYVRLVHEVAVEFFAAVQQNLRGRLGTDLADDAKMLFSDYTRTDRTSELLDELFYGPLRDGNGSWRMPDIIVKPAERGEGFSLRYENWLREAKVPVLVLNATTLNTGHSWQFTASWMGEPPSRLDERVDASQRLRRVYYRDAPETNELQAPRLSLAVAASACVPGLFPPIRLQQLYDDIDVELVDGGVHDNQGIASLTEQDCAVMLVSDASGQQADDESPKRWLVSVLRRTNSILMKRVRGAQYDELIGRRRSGALRGFMAVHLTMGLPAPPRDWSKCKERWTPEDDALATDATPPYIDEDVQRALARLRTDLDAFSDDEAYGLMAAGYEMTRRELSKALPDQAAGDPELEQLVAWPFAAVLAELTSGDASRLAASLKHGDARFFRGTRRWIDGRREDLRSIAAKLGWGR